MGKRKTKARQGDFKQQKERVGKRTKAANATSTTFKVKTLAIPAQSVASLKDEATNKRNLTLKELLQQVQHYNVAIRADALYGLRDLFVRHPHVLQESLGLILEKVMPVVADPEVKASQGLLALLDHIVTVTSAQQLGPFFPLIVVHVRAAMTHVNDSVSKRALPFLELLLAKTPELLVANGKDVLRNLVRLLGRRSLAKTKAARGTPGRPVSAQGCGQALHLLLVFIGELVNTKKASPTPSNTCSGQGQHWHGGLCLELYPNNKPLHKQPTGQLFSSIYHTAGGRGAAMGAAQPSSAPDAQLSENYLDSADSTLQCIQVVLPHLFEVWVEIGPSVFGPGPTNQQALKALEEVASMARLLLQHFYRQQRETGLTPGRAAQPLGQFSAAIKQHWMGVFPLGRDKAMEGPLQGLVQVINMDLSEVAALLFLAASEPSSGTAAKKNTDAPDWGAEVLDYIMQQLSSPGIHNGARSFSSVTSLLDTVELLLDGFAPGSRRAQELLQGTADLFQGLHIASPAKGIVATFLSRHCVQGSEPQPVGLQFISTLPNVLCQLGTKNPQMTADILNLLASLAARTVPVTPAAQVLEEMKSGLASYLRTSETTKKGGAREQYGPFVHQPPAVQHSFLELLAYYTDPGRSLLDALAAVCLHPLVTADVALHALSMAAGRWGRVWQGSEPLDSMETLSALVSFFVSVLLGDNARVPPKVDSGPAPNTLSAAKDNASPCLRSTPVAGGRFVMLPLIYPEARRATSEDSETDHAHWTKRCALVDAACRSLLQLPMDGHEYLLKSLEPMLLAAVTNRPVAVDSAVSLVLATSRFAEAGAPPGQDLLETLAILSTDILEHVQTTANPTALGTGLALHGPTAVAELTGTAPSLAKMMRHLQQQAAAC